MSIRKDILEDLKLYARWFDSERFKEKVEEKDLEKLSGKGDVTRWSKVVKESYKSTQERKEVKSSDNFKEKIARSVLGRDMMEKYSELPSFPSAEHAVINSTRQHNQLASSVANSVHLKPLVKVIHTLIDLDSKIMEKAAELAYFQVEITHNNIVSKTLRSILNVELPTDRLEDNGKHWTEVVKKSTKQDTVGLRKKSLLKALKDNYADDPSMLTKVTEVIHGNERDALFKQAAEKNNLPIEQVRNNFFGYKLWNAHVSEKEWEAKVVAFKKEFKLD
jgi:hypothetical protein